MRCRRGLFCRPRGGVPADYGSPGKQTGYFIHRRPRVHARARALAAGSPVLAPSRDDGQFNLRPTTLLFTLRRRTIKQHRAGGIYTRVNLLSDGLWVAYARNGNHLSNRTNSNTPPRAPGPGPFAPHNLCCSVI